MSKRNQRPTEYNQPEDSYIGEYAPEEDRDTEDGWVHLMDFKPDPRAICLRLEHGIPPLLAAIVPSDMDIKSVGDIPDDPMYIVRKIVACGTVEDIVNQIAQLKNNGDN